MNDVSRRSRPRIEWDSPAKLERELNSLLGLGRVAAGLEKSLAGTKELLAEHEPYIAPDGWCILVEPNGEALLVIEKLVADEEGSQGHFTQHFSGFSESVNGVSINSDGYLVFIGKEISYDKQVGGFYVYHESGTSRVLHRTEESSTVTTLPLEEAQQRLYP